jgi:beta-lactam-binding protein with PASTA domain
MKIDFLEILKSFKEQSFKGLLLNLGLIILIGLIMVFIFFSIFLPSITNHDDTLTVPNLEGMHYDQLEEFLGKRELSFEVQDSAYSSVYEPMTVLKQYPPAGELVKEGRKIYIIIKSREPEKVRMPNLIDGSLKNAELILKSYGLKRGEITYRPDLAVNSILEQWYDGKKIEPDALIAKGSEIDLIVGDGFGNRQFQIGNFVGRDLEDVEFALNGQGLTIGTVIIQIVDEDFYVDLNIHDLDSLLVTDSEMVVRQNPEFGSTVRLGDIVDLWVGVLSQEDSLNLLEKRSKSIMNSESEGYN